MDHYQCSHYFVPNTSAYQISGSAELFPQYCQVPFLMWNDHLQEAISKLNTTLYEMPPIKRARVIYRVHRQLTSSDCVDSMRTLIDPNHEWILPPGDLQQRPYISPQNDLDEQRKEQRVEQRVATPTLPPTPTFACITNSPLIMAAPNPTLKQALKLTKQTHSRWTRNNIPGSVPPITNTTLQHIVILPPVPPITASHCPPQTPTAGLQTKPIRLPKIRFVPVKGGQRNNNTISQEVINFLTKCIWEKHLTYLYQTNYAPSQRHHVAILHKLPCQWYIPPLVKPSAATSG